MKTRFLSLVAAVAILAGCLSGTSVQAEKPADRPERPHVSPSAQYVIYINWDGFDYRYLDWANGPDGPGTPVLNDLIKHGVFFRNHRSGIPSITNPMQTTLVTGAWPNATGNTYRYYDRAANLVKQTGRENAAETIAEAAVRQGLNVVSVQQFTLQDRGTAYGDPAHLYIQPGGSFGRRVDELIKILRGDPVASGTAFVTVTQLPEFIALYGDDLDAMGHNEVAHPELGFPAVATSSAQRRAFLLQTMANMDAALGRLMEALKEAGIDGRTAIVLASDHGMYEYNGLSSLPALQKAVVDAGFKVDMPAVGKKPVTGTDIVVVDVGLQVQLSWARTPTEEQRAKLESTLAGLSGQPWFGGVLTRDEMLARGAHPSFADYLVWPKDGYHFKTSPATNYVARGQHDTPLSDHVPLIIAGAAVRTGLEVNEQTLNIDVAPTIARLLGIEAPLNAQGRILGEALNGAEGAPGQGK